MSYELAQHPQWTLDELRVELFQRIHDMLPTGDKGRLQTVDAAMYYPPTEGASNAACNGEIVGPLVQIVAALRYVGDESEYKVMRVVVPHLLKWSDVPALVEQFRSPLIQTLNLMHKEEVSKRRVGQVFTDNGPVMELTAINDA